MNKFRRISRNHEIMFEIPEKDERRFEVSRSIFVDKPDLPFGLYINFYFIAIMIINNRKFKLFSETGD